MNHKTEILNLAAAAVLMFCASAGAQEVKHFRFAHDLGLHAEKIKNLIRAIN